jgi:phospholipid transport system transporter-binding protein
MSELIRQAPGRLAVSGNMTMETAPALLAAGVDALTETESVFDLSGVVEVDSSGLAVLFGWQRAARAQNKRVGMVNPPRNLVSLAVVYGVTELLPLS